MRVKFIFPAVLLALLMALFACGGDGDDDPTGAVGDAANGERLFAGPLIGANDAPGCITCHSLEPDVVIVGPSQAGVAARAGLRVPGQSAEAYLRAAITAPDEYVVEGFAPGVMYQHYETDLTTGEIDDLVAFLLTLE